MRYKLSHYNVSHRVGNDEYIWNTYSGALLGLDENGKKYLDNFSGLDDGSVEFQILKSNKFIVDDRFDEIGNVVHKEKQAMFSRTSEKMSIVISLGMGCNYRCIYCFQNDNNKKDYMDLQTANDVGNYICRHIESHPNLKLLNIKWFGGEPLLYTEAMEIISKKVMECTSQKGVVYSAGLITNGRFLDYDTAEKVKFLNVEKVQITIDGTCETYCESKGATEGDFYTVINNVCNLADRMKTTVRLNIPNNNAEKAIDITNYLLIERKLLGKIRIYFAYVRDFTQDRTKGEENYKLYVDNYLKWLKYIVERFGYSIIEGTYPKRKVTSCGYIRANNLCIGCKGELYKCEHCFGDKDLAIGDIWNGRFHNETESLYYTTIDERNDKTCLVCPYLPICMGGCANDYVHKLIGQECKSFQRMQFELKLLEGREKA